MKGLFAKPVGSQPEANPTRRRAVAAAGLAVLLLGLYLLPSLLGGGDLGRLVRSGGWRPRVWVWGTETASLTHTTSLPFPTQALRERFPESFRIGVISDLDKKSKRSDKEWYSVYMTVRDFRWAGGCDADRPPHPLTHPPPPPFQGTMQRTSDKYTITWDAPANVVTSHNEAGRGAELSELVRFNGALYAFDDRTGIMFEVMNPEDSSKTAPGEAPFIVPRHLFMEGDGTTDKGLKCEWATVKDGLLYVGSFGKEFTDNKGAILHANNLWVVMVGKDGTVTHADWRDRYTRMRDALGYTHPAYLLHETVVWSPFKGRWFVLPRRMSKEPYDDAADELRGANTIISASVDFKEFKTYTVGVREMGGLGAR